MAKKKKKKARDIEKGYTVKQTVEKLRRLGPGFRKSRTACPRTTRHGRKRSGSSSGRAAP